MTEKRFNIEFFRDDATLNGTSLDGTEMAEGVLPDGTEVYMLALPKDLVSTKLSLRTSLGLPVPAPAPAKEIEAAPKAEAVEAPAEPEVAEEAPKANGKPPAKRDRRPKSTRKLTQRPDAANIEPIDVRTSLSVLKLTSPTVTRLEENGITTIGQLTKKTEDNLRDLGLGPNTVATIRTSLYRVGHFLTIKDPKLTDVCLAPMTLRKLREHGVRTISDLTALTEEEVRIIPGVNENQFRLFTERLTRFGMSFKASTTA